MAGSTPGEQLHNNPINWNGRNINLSILFSSILLSIVFLLLVENETHERIRQIIGIKYFLISSHYLQV